MNLIADSRQLGCLRRLLAVLTDAIVHAGSDAVDVASAALPALEAARFKWTTDHPRGTSRKGIPELDGGLVIFRTTLIVCGGPSFGPPSPGRRRRHRAAYEHATVWVELGDDPLRYLLVGPDRSGHMLELVVIHTAESVELVIHAMALRRSTERELFGREWR